MNIVEANVDYKVIGQRIRDARLQKGWSQDRLSEALDISIVYISRVERGTSKINLTRLSQISIALGVPIEKLITGATMESKTYLDKEFHTLLSQCTPDKQQLIYNIAKVVKDLNFV